MTYSSIKFTVHGTNLARAEYPLLGWGSLLIGKDRVEAFGFDSATEEDTYQRIEHIGHIYATPRFLLDSNGGQQTLLDIEVYYNDRPITRHHIPNAKKVGLPAAANLTTRDDIRHFFQEDLAQAIADKEEYHSTPDTLNP